MQPLPVTEETKTILVVISSGRDRSPFELMLERALNIPLKGGAEVQLKVTLVRQGD